MDLKKTNLAEGKVKFLFMTNNRSISQNKALRESILKKGVLQPLTVIRAADVDDDISLTDGSQMVSKQGNEKALVILDGQHRYTELSDYDKYIVMQSKVRSIPDSQRLVRLLLTCTSHNNGQRPRSLSQSRRSLLFSHSLSESRLGTRSAYAFSRASRLAFESALA